MREKNSSSILAALRGRTRTAADRLRGLSRATRPAKGTAAGLLAAALAAGVAIPFWSHGAEAKEYVTAAAGRGTIDVRVDAKGVVQPENTVRVIAPGTGRVSWTGPEVGSRVRRGQPLARIAPAPAPAKAEAPRPRAEAAASEPKAPEGSDTKADLATAKAELEAARARRDKAQKEADKLAAIPDLVPRLQIEAARRDAEVAAAAFESAAARLRVAETAATARRAPEPRPAPAASLPEPAPKAAARADLLVTSPIDGIVVSRNAEVGQTISGAPTLFAIGGVDSAVEIHVAIPEVEAGSIREGQQAVASAVAAPDQAFAGQLSKVRAGSGSAALTAVLKVTTSEAALLRPGTKVDVDVSVARREDVLVVPAAALRFTPEFDGATAPLGDAQEGSAIVWVQAADGEVAARRVEVGMSDGLSTEIVGGLGEGDVVVTGEAGAETAAPATTAPAPDVVADAHGAGIATAVAPDLAFATTAEVETYLRLYSRGSGRLTAERAFERSSGLRARAEEIFAEEGVPSELVWLALVESGWRNSAVSPVGAAGIWQFMPYTAERFGLRVDDEVDERYDFEKATRAAATYLRVLNVRYDGNWELAIGAYNCGEGAMDRAIERAGGVENFWVLARAGVLPDETARYVPAVLAATIVGAELG